MTRLGGISPSGGPLAKYGICAYPDPYSASEILDFNARLDPLLRTRAGQARAYVHVDELEDAGLLRRMLSPAMRNILFSIMPDPVLFHCLVSEIAGNDTRSHFGAETMSGWHRDSDSELVVGEVTHVSVFTYLSDVGPLDGAFEISPKWPLLIRGGDPSVLVTGPAGQTFAWRRSFFHRASPNRGPRRRRIIKLSIQRNRFPSHHLHGPRFRAALAAIPAGDTGLDVLLGRFQGGKAPAVAGVEPPPPRILQPTGTVDVPMSRLLPGQLRFHARELKRSLEAAIQGPSAPATETY